MSVLDGSNFLEKTGSFRWISAYLIHICSIPAGANPSLVMNHVFVGLTLLVQDHYWAFRGLLVP